MSTWPHLSVELPRWVAAADSDGSWPSGELFRTLELLLPVRFSGPQGEAKSCAGSIRYVDPNEDGPSAPAANVSSLSVPTPPGIRSDDRSSSIEVAFADDPDVPFPFRGRTIRTTAKVHDPAIVVDGNEKVLATCQRRPVWSVRRVGEARHFRSGFPLPIIGRTGTFHDVFSGERFLEALPLLHFLRMIGDRSFFDFAPLRAAFVIDDPNLHWPRYGFVDYSRIALHAQRENYHVCFATIPLDAWFTHAGTARLFHQNSRWISLCVHGNDHAKEELAKSYSQVEREGLLRQTVDRVVSLERKAGIRISRVMVPPHGACSSQMLGDLAKFNFEAACVSAGSLQFHNQAEAWTRTLGYFPAEVINGCSVLPRSGLDGSVENVLLVAAYLGRPMIIRGHHGDFRRGMEAFDGIAKYINGLGDVRWSNMTGLGRSSYLWRMEGTTTQVRTFGGTIAVPASSATTEITIDSHEADINRLWRVFDGDTLVGTFAPGQPVPVTPMANGEIVATRVVQDVGALATTGRRRTSGRHIVRRLLTECRDRLRIS